MPGVVDCNKCLKLSEEQKTAPNCEECNNPELLPENENIFALWQIVSDQRDFNGALRTEAVLSVLEAYNGTLEDFEMIMAFDRVYRKEAKKYQEKE